MVLDGDFDLKYVLQSVDHVKIGSPPEAPSTSGHVQNDPFIKIHPRRFSGNSNRSGECSMNMISHLFE